MHCDAVGMEDQRKRFDSVDDARTRRTHNEAVGVNCPNFCPIGQLAENGVCLSYGPVESEAAGRNDDDVGVVLCDGRPVGRYGSAASLGQNGVTAGCRHEVGHPVAREERGI